MNNPDYSIHYRRFHEDTEHHAVAMANWLQIYLKDDLPENRTLPALDVGCGFGYALRALRASGFTNIQGIEVSNDQAEIARRGGFNVSVVSDSVSYLQERKEEFGIILLMDVLEHIPVSEQIQFASAIRSALRPGGRLVLTVPNANSLLAARLRYIDFTHFASFTEHSLFFVLKNAGFGNIVMDNTKGIGRFPRRFWRSQHRDSVRKWLMRTLWLQVFKAELHPSENLEAICFELNLKAVAFNDRELDHRTTQATAV